MIRVNALLLLLLIEALVMCAAAAAYLLYRLKKGGGGSQQPRSIKAALQKLIEARLTEPDPQQAQASEVPTDRLLVQDLKDARTLHLRQAAERLAKGDGKLPAVWEALSGAADEALRSVLAGKREALAARDAAVQEAASLGKLKDERDQLQNLVVRQAKKIADLFSYKDLIADTRKRLGAIETVNADVLTAAGDLLTASSKVEASRMVLSNIDKNGGELKASMQALEKEAENLNADYLAWQKELKSMEDASGDRALITGWDGSSVAAYQQRIEDLEKRLAAKERELKETQKKIETLEQEYLVLYNEKNK